MTGSPPDSRLEHEALFFAEMLRSTRLVLLYGEEGCGKTWLLKHGVLPLLGGDVRRERAVYFDTWDDAPLTALTAAIERALNPSAAARRSVRAFDVPWVVRLTALTKASGKSLLVILDHFERFLSAPPSDGRKLFEQQWATVLAAEMPVNFLVSMRADAEPLMMARLGKRISSLADNRLVLPPLHRRLMLGKEAPTLPAEALHPGPPAAVRETRPLVDAVAAQASAFDVPRAAGDERPGEFFEADRSTDPGATRAGRIEPRFAGDAPPSQPNAESRRTARGKKRRKSGATGEANPEAKAPPHSAPLTGNTAAPPRADADAPRATHDEFGFATTAGAQSTSDATEPVARRAPPNAEPTWPHDDDVQVHGGLQGQGTLHGFEATGRAEPAPESEFDDWFFHEAPREPAWRRHPPRRHGRFVMACLILAGVTATAWTFRDRLLLEGRRLASGGSEFVAVPPPAQNTRPLDAPVRETAPPRAAAPTTARESNPVPAHESGTAMSRDPAAPLSRQLGLALASVHEGSGAPVVSEGIAGLQASTGRTGGTGLVTVRYDVLDALRDEDRGDSALERVRLLAPLQAEPLYFVARRDEPIKFVHEIAGRRLNLGAGGTDAAVGAVHLYRTLFAVPYAPRSASFLPEAAALEALLLERSVDVAVLSGSAGFAALMARQRAMPDSFKLLALDPKHASTRRARRAYLTLDIHPDGRLPGVDHTVQTLGVMSFLVARAPADEASGKIVRALCEHLPYLRQISDPRWRETTLASVRAAGWRYAPAAERELRACEDRRVAQQRPADVRPPAAAVSAVSSRTPPR